ncbi:aldo/keto reductase [Catenuloplanes sp. NPDC051500]|uniref:aldo/keto reductase n=1 Tax=Catenuloplanes sp. NPDC051500 TaxID=3363959 RepID=UPI00378883C1
MSFKPTSRIGFGAMQLSRLHGDRAAAIAVLRRAEELGVDHVDTARFYGNGFADEVVREALGGRVTVVTKVGAAPHPPQPWPKAAQRPAELRAEVEANLTGLGVDRLDVVNLRRNDTGPGGPLERDQIVDVEDQLAELIALRDEGKIGGIGLSSVSLDVLRRGLPAGIVCVQNAYSLANRSDEALLQLCVDEDIAWVPYFPLGSAFPGVPKVTDRPAVIAAAARLGATPAQIGLAWLLHRAPNVLPIPGTADVAHLEENMGAASITLDDETLRSLES